MPTPLPPKLSQPALRALASVEVSHLEDLQKFKEKQIAALHGMGPSGIKLLKAAMEAVGMGFAASK